ncbi:MAG: ABC transporter ATP-binding protein [Alphaproteobacteria bacterium]|nr:ABC transporter ATP-binding protein [Alphaproteobacteria bacterium]
MAEPLLSVTGLCRHFGGVVATDNVSLTIAEGELHAIIGPNGAGKTTLVAQLMGELRPHRGTIRLGDRDVTTMPSYRRSRRGIARSFQITSIFPEFTARDNIALAVQAHAGHNFRFWRAARTDPALRKPACAILDSVGLGHRADVPAATLAHGEQRLLEIAIALAARPRLLLLDEPMAGMAPEDAARMVRFLSQLKGKITLLLIEHDMDAVFALADRITVMVYGSVIASGTPGQIRANAEVRKAYLGEDELA